MPEGKSFEQRSSPEDEFQPVSEEVKQQFTQLVAELIRATSSKKERSVAATENYLLRGEKITVFYYPETEEATEEEDEKGGKEKETEEPIASVRRMKKISPELERYRTFFLWRDGTMTTEIYMHDVREAKARKEQIIEDIEEARLLGDKEREQHIIEGGVGEILQAEKSYERMRKEGIVKAHNIEAQEVNALLRELIKIQRAKKS